MPDEELITIQRLIDREHHFRVKWQPASFKDDVMPLVITLENYLKEVGYDDKEERRDARLSILGRITRSNVETANQLSAYQCKTIYRFLVDKDSEDFRTTRHGKALLDSLTRDIESFGVFKKEQGNSV
jgi:hypothetical protein